MIRKTLIIARPKTKKKNKLIGVKELLFK